MTNATIPKDYFTRAELVQLLTNQGYIVTDRQLRRWATYRWIPKPTRRVPPGAVDRRVRAVFHRSIIPLVMTVALRDQVAPTMAVAVWRYVSDLASDHGKTVHRVVVHVEFDDGTSHQTDITDPGANL